MFHRNEDTLKIYAKCYGFNRFNSLIDLNEF